VQSRTLAPDFSQKKKLGDLPERRPAAHAPASCFRNAPPDGQGVAQKIRHLDRQPGGFAPLLRNHLGIGLAGHPGQQLLFPLQNRRRFPQGVADIGVKMFL